MPLTPTRLFPVVSRPKWVTPTMTVFDAAKAESNNNGANDGINPS